MSARPNPAKVRGGNIATAVPQEVRDEARRLDRPVAWVMQRAWLIAKPQIRKCQPRAR
jgi:uncharacterized small protein (TIGR04563 family)